MRLVGKFLPDVGQVRSAGAGAGRVAALRHEAVDHAVKDDAVVKSVLGQRGDALDMAGGEIGTELDHHRAGVEFEGQPFIGHVHSFRLEMAAM